MEGRIALRPLGLAGQGQCVGTLDGVPLFIDGKTARVGDRSFPACDLGESMLAAVSHAATRLWGVEWTSKLAFVTGLNRRTCSTDRIASHGLPAWVLVRLGEMAATAHPRATGSMALAATFLLDAGADVEVTMHATVGLVAGNARGMARERNLHLVARAALRQSPEPDEATGPVTPGP